VLDLVPDQIFAVTRDGTILLANAATARSLGQPFDQIVGRNLFDLLDDPVRSEFVRAELERVIAAGREIRGVEDSFIDADGLLRVMRSTKIPLTVGDPGDPAMLGIAVDITEQRAATEALHKRAFYDMLTGLPNRQLFAERLAHAIARSGRREHPDFAVLFMDLDSFKEVNDTLGHHIGDELLVAAGRRLRDVVRPSDTVARFGGDEFAVLVEEGGSEHGARRVAARIHHALRSPFLVQDRPHFVSTSVGIALPGDQRCSAGELLRDADAAMFVAKKRGPGHTAVFSETIRQRATEHLRIKNELQEGLRRGELFLQFQPIVNLASGEFEGLEALVRWAHPRLGTVAPGEFLPVAERSGLMPDLEGFVLWEACRQLRRWMDRVRPPRFRLSINVSSAELADPTFADRLESAVEDHTIAPDWLIVELTESSLIDTSTATGATLERLRGMGVKIALDDFGTGFSSLSHLHSFPIDIIKIDRSFTSFIEQDDRRARILAATVGLGRELGLTVTAEGVETEEQRAWLQARGCHYGQGWLFDRPLDQEAILARFAREDDVTSSR